MKRIGVFFFCILAIVLVGLAFAGTVGKVTGTGAEITVSTGFVPKYVKVTNIDNGSSFEWYAGMTNATAIKTTGSAIGNTSITNATANGITPYAGTKNSAGAFTNQPGFKLGADTDVNVSGKNLHYKAE